MARRALQVNPALSARWQLVVWGLLGGGLSFLVAFALLTSGSSTTFAIGAVVCGCLALGVGIALDLRRADTPLVWIDIVPGVLHSAPSRRPSRRSAGVGGGTASDT